MTQQTTAPSVRMAEYYQWLSTTISPQAPCGVNLDDDPQFLLLLSWLRPKADAEYGEFYEPAEPVNWAETERVARHLLEKSKDIRLIIILMRCRLRQHGLQAITEGLETLQSLLTLWPDDLYPQLTDEGEFTPQLRANAFAELNDPQGLLADIRQQRLPKTAGQQITLREFEKAHTSPRAEGILSAQSAAVLVKQWENGASAEYNALRQASDSLHQLQQQLADALEQYAPDLDKLSAILSLFSHRRPTPRLSAGEPPPLRLRAEPSLAPGATPDPAITLQPLTIQHRDEARSYLQQLRVWFGETEPGSPVIPMLAYLEASIGRSFPELMTMYPPEIMSLLKRY